MENTDIEHVHCRSAKDGECNWEFCPQLRDNEPYATGRHCPLDHYCYYCGEDTNSRYCGC